MLLYGTPSPEEKVSGFTLMTADGGTLPNLGGAPFRQLSPAYPSQVEGQRRECFSEDIPNTLLLVGNLYLNSSAANVVRGLCARAQKSTATGKPDLTRGTCQI
jgi:hypothetical protein